MTYAELQVTSNYGFLRGASHPEELAETAAALGHTAIAITDSNTLAGVVRGHTAAKKAGIRAIIGCRLDLGVGTLAFFKNGAPHGPGHTGVVGPVKRCVEMHDQRDSVTVREGASFQ